MKSVIQDFTTTFDEKESLISPPNLFKIETPFLFLELPYCEQNEVASKRFIKKFHPLTDEKYITVKWLTKKTKITFSISRP